MTDIRTTAAGLVAGIAQILKLCGLEIPPEVLDAVTAVAVVFLGWSATDKAKVTP